MGRYVLLLVSLLLLPTSTPLAFEEMLLEGSVYTESIEIDTAMMVRFKDGTGNLAIVPLGEGTFTTIVYQNGDLCYIEEVPSINYVKIYCDGNIVEGIDK